MNIFFKIELNNEYEPYYIQRWGKKGIEAEEKAVILAFYEVKIIPFDKMSVFDVRKLKNNSLMFDDDETIYQNLESFGISKEEILYLIKELSSKVREMYFNEVNKCELKFSI